VKACASLPLHLTAKDILFRLSTGSTPIHDRLRPVTFMLLFPKRLYFCILPSYFCLLTSAFATEPRPTRSLLNS
jgi:hypothetical protein